MKRKGFWDKKAEKLAAKKINKVNEEDEESKDKQEEDAKDKDDKSKTNGDDSSDTKDDSADKPKDDSAGKSDSKQGGDKSDAKGAQPDAKDAKGNDAKDGKGDKPEPTPVAQPAPAPATRNYTGAGDISGVKDLRQEVVINGDVTVKQFGGAPLAVPPVGAKLDAFVESINAIEFTRAEEESFRNGDALYELKRAREEGEVPGAAIKFAELTFLKCPKKASKFIRDHISEAIEADPELLTFIREADARKHQIEKRFRPFRAEVSQELWTEAEARPYITDQKADLPPRLAENARDEDFGTWVLVEVNGDTGAIRELSEAEAAEHEKQAPAEPKKKPRSKKTEDKGEAV